MLKTSSCLSETISFHFACRPLRATSVRRAQPSDGASSQGNVGPGAPQGTMKNETGTMNKGTTGASLTRRRRQHFRREHCSRHP